MNPLFLVILVLAVFGVIAWIVFRQMAVDDKTRLVVLLGVLLIVAIILLFGCMSGCIPLAMP